MRARIRPERVVRWFGMACAVSVLVATGFTLAEPHAQAPAGQGRGGPGQARPAPRHIRHLGRNGPVAPGEQ